jgi:translation initiation factor 4E
MMAKGGRMDDAWLYTVLAVIGEEFTDGEEICGIVLSPRAKEIRLSIWTRTAKDETTQRRIGSEWKNVLGDSVAGRLEYQSHEDSMNSGTSYRTPTSYAL